MSKKVVFDIVCEVYAIILELFISKDLSDIDAVYVLECLKLDILESGIYDCWKGDSDD